MNHLASDQKIKVCLVAISLGKGGAERSTALLSQMFTEQGFEVYLVILEDIIDYEYSGTLLNLGKEKSGVDTRMKQWKRLQKFRKFRMQHRFDFIIDNRNRKSAAKELLYLNYVYKGTKVIYVVRSFKLSSYFPQHKLVPKIMIDKAFAVVGVSKAIATQINEVYQTQKAVAIYNPIEVQNLPVENVNEKCILFVGRIDDGVKNFRLLLEAFQRSKLADNGYVLKMYGNGPDEGVLHTYISELQLEKTVEHRSFQANIHQEMAKATFLVLTSRYEGFPRVLIESLSVGTPVVAVDCNSGPREVIRHEENGLLVKNEDVEALANAMNRLIFETELYERCKNNARESVAHLTLAIIGAQWKKLLQHV